MKQYSWKSYLFWHTDIVSGCCSPIYFHSTLSVSFHLNYSGGRSGGSDNSDCAANLLACLTTALPGCNWHNCQVRVRKTKAIWMWRDKAVSLRRTGDLEAAPWMMYGSNGGGGRGLQWGKWGGVGIVGGGKRLIKMAASYLCYAYERLMLSQWQTLYAFSLWDSPRYAGVAKKKKERKREKEKGRMHVINVRSHVHV